MSEPCKLLYNTFSMVFMQYFPIDGFDKGRLPEGCRILLQQEEARTKSKEKEDRDPTSLDNQIFSSIAERNPVERYQLKGFDFDLCIRRTEEELIPGPASLPEEEWDFKEKDIIEAHIKGSISIVVSVFFKRTVSVSYRLRLDGEKCRINNDESIFLADMEKQVWQSPTEREYEIDLQSALTTDHLISLAALNLGAEHWNSENPNDPNNYSTINLKLPAVKLSDVHVDANGVWSETALEDDWSETVPEKDKIPAAFEEIQKRYRKLVECCCPDKKKRKPDGKQKEIKPMNHVYVDIWETIGHTPSSFQDMELSEEEIITHIVECHKPELVGLMSLYPYEWPYRTKESYADVCGENIAIDTDDLVLTNPYMTVAFGTYGLRGVGEPTPWKRHSREIRKQFDVSWPEYLVILEMILARKYTINRVADELLQKAHSGLLQEEIKQTNILKRIEDNAITSIKAAKIFIELDVVRFSRFISHRIMIERTTKRLGVDRDIRHLTRMLEIIDKSFNNLNNVGNLRLSSKFNRTLLYLSIIAAFVGVSTIVFTRVDNHLFEHLPFSDSTIPGAIIAVSILFFVLVALVAVFVLLIRTGGALKIKPKNR